MKKFFVGLLIIVLAILAMAYVLLFTSFGNSILKPQVQKQIDKYSPIPMTLDVFVLRFGSFKFELNNQNNIFITSHGSFSLLSQSLDAMLNINIKNPSNIKELANAGVALKDDFLIENVIRGKITHFNIHTTSNIANGNLRVDTTIESFTPTKILANIENLQIPELLAIVGKGAYADGLLNITADIKGDKNLQFTGQANAKLSDGSINTQLIKQDFKVNVPKTKFIIDLRADFDGANIKHKLQYLSNIGNISSSGDTAIKTLRTNSSYDINISDLSPMTPFVGMPIRGSLNTNGKIIGNAQWLYIEGKSDIASSNTEYAISLVEYSKPKDVILSIKNLKLETIFYMLVKPTYANGLLNVDMNLKDVSSAINGNYSHAIKGKMPRQFFKTELNLNAPADIAFDNQANIVFNNGNGVLNSTLNTDVANLNIKDALLDANSLSLLAPYTLAVPNLKKLAFVTSKELKGSINVNGEVRWLKKSLYATAQSKLFNGDFDMILNNNLATITLKNMDSLGILDMLQYPQFFKSNINGNIKYDIYTQKGKIDFIMNKGGFAENKLTKLLRSLINFNATKEIYDNITFKGDINNKIINANLDMQSNNTSLNSNNMTIDLERDTIKADVFLKVQKYELLSVISGKISNPSIKIDTKSLGKNVVNSILQNEKVQEQKEKLEEKAKDVLQKGLDKLFNK